jgi:ATP-binding cassette subfamily C protein LapB
MRDGPESFAEDIYRIPNAATPSIVLASLISNLMATALPIAILIIYDRVLPNASEYTLGLLTAGVLGAVLIDVLIRIARGAIVGHRAARYCHRAFLGAMEKVLNANPREFQSVSTAGHLERVGAIDAIRESRAGYLPQLWVDFPFFLLFLGLVFLIGGPELGLILFGFICVTGASAAITRLSVRARMEARQTNSSAQSNFLMEVLTGLATIKSYAMEPLMKRRYERVMESSATITANLINGSITAQAVTNLITQAAQIAVVAAGSLLVINGQMTIGGIAACMLLTGRALQPLHRASMLWSQYQSVRIAKQRIADLKAMPTVPNGGGIVREHLHGSIEFRDVDFSYGDRIVFERLSFTVEASETVLISSSGSWGGKSTLLALAGHILLPDRGHVLYDNIEADAFDDEWLRSRIAYLPQNPALFEGTIFNNLTGFDPTPEHIEAVEEVAEELGLTEAVSKLPLGYQTEVRSTGSETQPASIRQQIPIVRALARFPNIILLDECNSNLDRTADDRFRAALQRRQTSTTILMVTPRPSFQNLAQREITIGDELMPPPDTGTDSLGPGPELEMEPSARILTAAGGRP